VPRLVDASPNGPRSFRTVQVFLAGGVPEVMLQLRDLGVLDLECLTVTGKTLRLNLEWWERSERRRRFREILKREDSVEAGDVIGPMTADQWITTPDSSPYHRWLRIHEEPRLPCGCSRVQIRPAGLGANRFHLPGRQGCEPDPG
jgi:dihydroxyacid dehydratase/phosphogluconate dehydratase